jgi:MBG domain (YGX type)
VTADDKTKVYGSVDPALTVTVPACALETGDSLSGNLVPAAGNNVGGYAISKGTLTAGGNHDLTVTAAR